MSFEFSELKFEEIRKLTNKFTKERDWDKVYK